MEELTQNNSLEVIKAQADAKFALTPIGQQVREFEATQRVAKMFAASDLIPDNFKNNIPNCAIAVQMAARINADPFMVMQNLYIVHGRPAFSAAFIIATVNQCGRFTKLEYKFDGEGDEYGCYCWAIAKGEPKETAVKKGTKVTWAMVKAEGWDKKPGSKWKTMPEQMFRYRAAAFWQRAFAPEISMGFTTSEELHDIEDAEYVEVTPKRRQRHSLMELASKNIADANTINVDTQTGEVKLNDVPEPQEEQAQNPEPQLAETVSNNLFDA